MLKIGDKVSWESQAQGYNKKKVGVVVGVIPAGEQVAVYLDAALANIGSTIQKDYGGARLHESYLVVVSGKVYWPRVCKLVKAE